MNTASTVTTIDAEETVVTTPESTHRARSRRRPWAIWAAAALVIAVALVIALHVSWTGFLYAVGVHDYGQSSSQWYNFWSGFGSDLGEASIFTGLIVVFRHHNCQVHGCWRLGTHPVDGTPYHACHIHHPAVPSSRQDITADLIEREWHACHPSPPPS